MQKKCDHCNKEVDMMYGRNKEVMIYVANTTIAEMKQYWKHLPKTEHEKAQEAQRK